MLECKKTFFSLSHGNMIKPPSKVTYFIKMQIFSVLSKPASLPGQAKQLKTHIILYLLQIFEYIVQ